MSLRWSLMGSGRGQGWPFGYRLDGTRDSALLTDSGLLEDDGEGDQLVCGAEACHPIFAHEDMGEHDCGGAAVVYWPSPTDGPEATTPFVVLLVDLLTSVRRNDYQG